MALLTISIPIYNRSKFLERMLERFMMDKVLFDKTIDLFISDNCSEDDLESICTKYQDAGLNLSYSRNSSNLGMDGNFEICIQRGVMSDYLWVLGSDDIPTIGFFDILLPLLEKGINCIHISNEDCETEISWYDNVTDFLKDINVMITFLSGNIISTREIKNIDLKKYRGTYFTQVPVYLSTIFTGKENVFLKCKYLQDGSDSVNNGGYNFYKVFVNHYLDIWNEYVDKGLLERKDYENIKKTTFESFLWWYIQRTISKQLPKNLETAGWKMILFKNYGTDSYFYSHLCKYYIGDIKHKIRKLLLPKK